jgi:hypothetical protein
LPEIMAHLRMVISLHKLTLKMSGSKAKKFRKNLYSKTISQLYTS